MYFLSKLLLFAVAAVDVLLVHGAPTPLEDTKSSELDRRIDTTSFSRVSTTSKRLFQLAGKTQYFAGASLSNPAAATTDMYPGTNAWWLGHFLSNQDVDTAVAQMAAVSTAPSRNKDPGLNAFKRLATRSSGSGASAPPTTRAKAAAMSTTKSSTPAANTSTTTLPTASLASTTPSPPRRRKACS